MKVFIPFLKGISPEMNVIAWLKFEPAYDNGDNHDTKETPPPNCH